MLLADVADLLVAGRGVIVVREHPSRRSALYRLATAGVLVSPLPGILIAAERADDIDLRLRAVAAWRPDAVLTGGAAARATFWPEIRLSQVTAATPAKLVSPPGFLVRREHLPPELVTMVDGLRLTVPALTALDLVQSHGGAGIDRALLRRACSLAEMHEVLRLTPDRPGNQQRRLLLHDSRDEPWSEAERLGHSRLRSAGITDFRTNFPVRVGSSIFLLDVAFPSLKVAIEIDGFEVHSRFDQFQHDRRKWSALTSVGWRLLHVTWHQLSDEAEEFLGYVRSTLRRAA